MANRKPQNFGNRIYGSRADTAKRRYLSKDDIEKMTPEQLSLYVKRDAIWEKDDAERLLSEGVEKVALYFRDAVRRAVYTSPRKYMKNTVTLSEYALSVQRVRDKMEEIKTYEDIEKFFSSDADFFYRGGNLLSISPIYGYALDERKVWHFYAKTKTYMVQEMKENHFLESERDMLKVVLREEGKIFPSFTYGSEALAVKDEEAHVVSIYRIPTSSLKDIKTATAYLIDTKAKLVIFAGDAETCAAEADRIFEERKEKRKKERAAKRNDKFIPPQLKVIERTGSDYTKPRIITGKKFMDDFGLSGGQYGNWMTMSDRRKSLSMAYDALADLASALGVEEASIGLSNTLGIAFGARGRGGSALAHYETKYKVINLTRTHGAGSLAHEWGHALDNFIYDKIKGGKGSIFATNDRRIMPEMDALVRVMCFDDSGTHHTKFYRSAIALDSERTRLYFAKREEMFARAFACYVKDKLAEKGIRSDYLTGHADAFLNTAPQGEERMKINEAFDNLIAALKDRHILEAKKEIKKTEKNAAHLELPTQEDEDGQLCFVF